MNTTHAMEDYLEAMLNFEDREEAIRVKTLAEELNIKPPSVIDMMKNLIKNSYVTQEPRGEILLTKTGRKIGQQTKKRHDLISKFLNQILKVDKKTAEIDACAIEHLLSKTTYVQLEKFVNNYTKK